MWLKRLNLRASLKMTFSVRPLRCALHASRLKKLLSISMIGAPFLMPDALARDEENIKKHNGQAFIESIPAENGAQVSLTNLSPYINKWFVLKVTGVNALTVHIENTMREYTLRLTQKGISFVPAQDTTLKPHECSLWGKTGFVLKSELLQQHRNPFYAICDGLLYVRLARSSNARLSMTEWGTEVLRQFSFGESLINAVKPALVSLEAEHAKSKDVSGQSDTSSVDGPSSAAIDPAWRDSAVVEHHLGIRIANPNSGLRFGKWYQAVMHEGIYVSMMTDDKLPANGVVPHPLDAQKTINLFPRHDKNDSLIYGIAYDLDKYGAQYAVGTEQPTISTAVVKGGKNLSLNSHIVGIGQIPPYAITSAVGVFVGGFKTRHGYFRAGPHMGKHYGFIENGVELETMDKGIATLYTKRDGSLTIGRWPESDEAEKQLRMEVTSARQNGELLVENGAPGPLVDKWREGNWSGDAQGRLQSLRSAVCMNKSKNGSYLMFFAFTSTTPAMMTRTLMAYGCHVAMQLDMNALMYMHNAIYKVNQDNSVTAEYLHSDMEYPKGLREHRFILDNNVRDFFYVFKKGK